LLGCGIEGIDSRCIPNVYDLLMSILVLYSRRTTTTYTTNTYYTLASNWTLWQAVNDTFDIHRI